jgi:exodeoxyribonuclease V beta subunit
MTPAPPFQLTATPLAAGTTLIEASAGTGKTFTIAGLFLRLILERDFSVREILVVTFTEAATEELRDRIRRTLADAAAAFRAGGSSNDVMARLIAPHLPQSRQMLARLDRALRGFDEAPIFTIHGFCQRTLKDRAFESGALFDTRLLTDESDLLQAIADDYWRTRFYEAGPLPVGFALKKQLQPASFLPLLREQTRHPLLQYVSRVDGRELDELIGALEKTFAAARAVWLREKDAIAALLDPDAGWAKGDHAKPEVFREKLAQAVASFASKAPTPEALAALEFFSRGAIEEETNSKSESPAHEFFELCEELGEREADFLTGLKLDFIRYGRIELPRRKRELKAQSYGDLLTNLHAALNAPGGEALAREVRAKYRAALIDEFQDTDPVQYQIFRRLFAVSGARPSPGAETQESQAGQGSGAGFQPAFGASSPGSDHGQDARPDRLEACPTKEPLLFLIGDPKQAIYGFRGADIFTYLEAAARVDQRYTLEQNWRSETPLVRAVNSVFGFAENPFVFEPIQFQPVRAAGEADQNPLTENGQPLPSLHLWFVPREPGAIVINKGDAEDTLPALVAAEIVRLLNSNTRLGPDRLAPRDIAVLVRKREQARRMQEALRAVCIPSVLHTEESVFASREAGELSRVLAALAQPASERLLRAALATDLMGVDGSTLEKLGGDEAGWQARCNRFHAGHERWRQRGFMPMFREWLREENVRARLLAFADGERRLTNLLHLAEALHQAALERRLGASELARWLHERIAASDQAAEEHQLRLERDDQAVRLVTIHKSKGLEYPVVFCPFSWDSSSLRRGQEEEVLFHAVAGAPDSDPARTSAGRNASSLEARPGGENGSFPLTPALSPGEREPRRPAVEDSTAQFFRDLGSENLAEHRALAFRERLAENLRLLYVTLTRARNRCYLVWGGFKEAGSSAPAWLFHRPANVDGDLKEILNAHFKLLDDAALRRDLGRLVAGSVDDNGQACVRLTDIPQPRPEPCRPDTGSAPELRPREFSGVIDRHWRITSFSNLTAGARDERPDYDPAAATQAVTPPASAIEPAGIFAFPRGTAPGTCLHKIFEELDFTQAGGAALETLVTEKLRAHGFVAREFGPGVCDAIRRTLAVPLDPARPDLTLSCVPPAERLNELEFYFPVSQLSPALLAAGFVAPPHSTAWLERINFKPTRGFVKGFIDLVLRFDGRFYIVDWKSNWLGNRAEDYGPVAMAREMSEHFYPLQYHLYTVALHQYLALRLPDYKYENHFGGVCYLFVRGIDPARPELGVHRDRPPAALIERLSGLLLARSEEAPA